MNQYRDLYNSLLKRAVIAVPFFVLGLVGLSMVDGGFIQGFAMVLFGCAGIILAGEKIDRIVSSPLSRVRDTAAAVAAHHEDESFGEQGGIACSMRPHVLPREL